MEIYYGKWQLLDGADGIVQVRTSFRHCSTSIDGHLCPLPLLRDCRDPELVGGVRSEGRDFDPCGG